MSELGRGEVRKMRVSHADPVEYVLPLGEGEVPMNALIGKTVTLTHLGRITCIACGRETKKSFAQGYCFPCFRSLAECDMCVMRPETCHFHLGTCRDEQWARGHCMQPHYVYIANSSGLKVGITRGNQLPTRWIDQGATQAIAVFRVQSRLHSGLLEATIKSQVSDRTDWRRMLKGEADSRDMRVEADAILAAARPALEQLREDHEGLEWEALDEPAVSIRYPVSRYPEKVTSFNLDKKPEAAGVLEGIKGQYLIFDTGVINLRKYSGYEVSIAA